MHREDHNKEECYSDGIRAPLYSRSSVDFTDFYISDLSGLSHLKNLHCLVLGNTPVTDVSPLSTLTGFKQLKKPFTH